MDYSRRIRSLTRDLEQPLLVTDLRNIRYLTGFTGSSASLLATPSGCTFFTDGRYSETAEELVSGLPDTKLVVSTSGLHETLSQAMSSEAEVQLEAAHVTWDFVDRLRHETSAELIASTGIVERYRRCKDSEEIEALRRAAAAGDDAFALLSDLLETSTTEENLAERLVMAMREAGGERAGWGPIVAAGANASRPHHETGADQVGPGVLLLDYGCTVAGYHSDMSRTVHTSEAADPELDRVHRAVQEANEAGIAAVSPGVVAGDVDAVCRKVLENHGYAEYFTHSTGHGVGLDIHEEPWLRRGSEDVLEPGHVVTVEPGVYLPGRLGVRIEDMVLVTESGHEVLTSSSKELRHA